MRPAPTALTRALLAGLCLLAAAPGTARAQTTGFEIDPDAVSAIRETGINIAANVLQDAIRISRAEALRAGVQPMPTAIRARLQGFFPDELLDRVRYRVGGGSDQSLQLNVIRYGDQAAITLDDVVVFARESDALGNSALWAHELWHVKQVHDWGLAEFAQRYARDHRAVESAAERAAQQYVSWAQRARAGAP
jgi:hypothetical protein